MSFNGYGQHTSPHPEIHQATQTYNPKTRLVRIRSFMDGGCELQAKNPNEPNPKPDIQVPKTRYSRTQNPISKNPKPDIQVPKSRYPRTQIPIFKNPNPDIQEPLLTTGGFDWLRVAANSECRTPSALRIAAFSCGSVFWGMTCKGRVYKGYGVQGLESNQKKIS
jgi:hypothetical protein